MTTRLAALSLLALLSACGSLHERLGELSAPEVSCAQSEVEVSNVFSTRSAARYTATCANGRTYRCISMGKPWGEEPETTCTPQGSDGGSESGERPLVARNSAPRGVLPGGWPRVRVEACGAELTLPPGAELKDVVEPTTQALMHQAEASAGGSSFGFSCSRLSVGETLASTDEILIGAVHGALQAVDGELLQTRKLSQPVGRAVLIRVKGAQMAMRVWLDGDWIYSASVVPIDRLPDGAVAEYLDRIAITRPAH